RSFMPEWLSMNGVMAGMIPVMVVLASRDMQAMEATSLRFWGVMSLATLVGGVVAYPVNVWLVTKGLKHGMGSVRALGAGGYSLEAEAMRMQAVSGEYCALAPAATTHEHMANHGKRSEHEGMAMTGGATGPQIAAVALLTLLALGAGVLIAGLSGGLTMSRTAESMSMAHAGGDAH